MTFGGTVKRMVSLLWSGARSDRGFVFHWKFRMVERAIDELDVGKIRRNIKIAFVVALVTGGALPLLMLFSANGSIADNPQRTKELTSVAWLLIILEWLFVGVFAFFYFKY